MMTHTAQLAHEHVEQELPGWDEEDIRRVVGAAHRLLEFGSLDPQCNYADNVMLGCLAVMGIQHAKEQMQVLKGHLSVSMA